MAHPGAGRSPPCGDPGNAYVTGWTDSINFPTTPGAYQMTYEGVNHNGYQTNAAFVTKISQPLTPIASVALVQQAANSGTSVTSLTVTLPQPPRVGDVLIPTMGSNNSTVSISGGGVSTWTYIYSEVNQNTIITYGVVDSSPSATITLGLIGTPSPGDVASIVSEWSGLTGTADGGGTANGTASPIATVALTTANANDLLISVGGDTGGMTPGSPGAGWTAFTAPAQQPQAAIETAYQIVSATGSYSDTWSDTGSTGWDAVIGAFQ